jgi:serine protease
VTTPGGQRSLAIQGVTLLTAALLAAGALPQMHAQEPVSYTFLLTGSQIERVVAAWNEELLYVPGEVLVKFRNGTTALSQGRALSIMRGPIDITQSTWIGEVLLARTTWEPDPEEAAAALRRQPEVEWAQPNYMRRLHATPNDPSFSRQWNFNMIEMPRAWDINPGANANIIVAIIDTGVTTAAASYTFPLWTGRSFENVSVPFTVSPDITASRIMPGRDFVFWSGPVLDLVGHGTHVAGTALEETNNNIGLSGIAYGARLLPLKACFGYWDLQILQSSLGIPGFVDPSETGSCPDSAVAQAIRFAADNGAGVINLSLGGPSPSAITLDALTYAVGRGAFVSLSMGNNYERGNAAQYPAAYAPQIKGATSVGAVGRTQLRAYYSNTGAHIELAAPGGDFREGGLPGVIYQIGLFDLDSDPFSVIRPRFDRYEEVPAQGTSSAAPHVAGVAAMLYSQGITNPAAIEAAMKRFARDIGPAGKDDEYGDGLIDARATLRGLGVAR